MSYDPRKALIVGVIANACFDTTGESKLDSLIGQLNEEPHLNAFLDDAGVMVLHAVVEPPATKVALFNAPQAKVADAARQVLFVKATPDVIKPSNMTSNILITSVNRSPVQSLHSLLQYAYSPMLLGDPTWSADLATEAQQLLVGLETGLGSALRGASGAAGSAGAPESFAGICFVADEAKFWEERGRSKGRAGEQARNVAERLSPIATKFGAISSMGLSEVLELVDETYTVLDDIWRMDRVGNEAYPQARMAHLFNIAGTALVRFIQTKLGSLNLWTGMFAEVRHGLREGIRICDRWESVCNELSGTVWVDFAQHPWVGEPHANPAVVAFGRRLEEILRLRTTHEELVRLLSADMQRQLRVAETFKPFSQLQPLHVNAYTQPAWEAAVKAYESRLGPVEAHIAENLRPHLSGASDRPHQILREVGRYRNLLKRPAVSQTLSAEREALLAQLQTYLSSVDGEVDTRSDVGGSRPSGARNTSPIVANIAYAQTVRNYVTEVLESATSLLGNLPGFSGFKRAATELISKVDVWQKEQFQSWVGITQDSLRDGDLSLRMKSSVMEFDAGGNMVVNYSEELVTFLREVRQLSELGMTLSSQIRDAAAAAEKYYRYGVMLKKVANYYNTMGSEIIPTQKPMLYDVLLAFETAVKSPVRRGAGSRSSGDVTWSDPSECADYVERLQRAADQVAAENRKLRKIHVKLSEEIVALMNIDLLRQRDAWKDRWAGIQGLVKELTRDSRKYTPERMARWLLHWDHQLYKALEFGYRMGLESLNEYLPEIKCEMVVAQKQLQFRPPLEELRANYYREMKKFISIPSVFTGFGNAAVYAKMADRNAASLVHVYRKAEILFARLQRLIDAHQEWVVLAAVDLDAFVEQHVVSVVDYDVNFKTLKRRRKDAEALADFQKIDCVSVSMAPFKAAVEDLMQRLSDALVLSLRKSLIVKLKDVEEFLSASLERLNDRPNSIDEIGRAKRDAQDISDRQTDIRAVSRQCDELKKMLLSVAGTNVSVNDVVVRLAKLPDTWNTFEIALSAFSAMIEEQRNKLKDSVQQEVITVNVTLDKVAQRWHALKPKELASWSAEEVSKVFQDLREWEQQIEDLGNQAASLTEHSESFGIALPKFPGLGDLQSDFDATKSMWNLYQQYNEERTVIATADWITFRSRLYDLVDFATKWAEQVAGKKNHVAERISTETARIRKAHQSLKYITGEPFKEEHWSQTFRKLGMPKNVRLETLTVGHFLDVLDAVMANLQFFKELTARAQGEVSIREALQEMRAWAETAEFSLLGHVEMGRSTMLICEWKDLFKDIGDHQSLLQSLKESLYFKPFADQALQFEGKLALLDQCCQNLNAIQRKWVYLEPIFGRGALPAEQPRFRRVDEDFRDIMGKVENDKKIFNLADPSLFPGLGDLLVNMLDQLERCQKALADFLEEKRAKMPRFYFIGDDDLLEILGQAKNPNVIQAHLKKLYQGIHRVQFNQENTAIVAIVSVAGEVVPLARPVAISDEVESWLDRLSKEMVSTLADLLVQCLNSTTLDVRKFPSQILGLSEQIRFTKDCEAQLAERGNLTSFKQRLQESLRDYTSQDFSSEPLTQLKIKSLVLDLIHHMDVVDQLIAASARSVNDWSWKKQLRFYLNKQGRCVARMVDAECEYTYEYQGNYAKLVHTPLTDKCYLTLTQGMAMGYGGNPYGPAGTGKTESVKALGAALGRQVLVFNCDEGIDFQSMGRIFTGLVKCGAWGCFDEFNRLKEDQLSAVSQQIQVIQAAIKERTPSLLLLGATINVDFNAGIFVTMNPAGKGYGGRSKLPDNLKALFRPVAMSVPDNELIAEVILYSEGFLTAAVLAKKMVSLFSLSRELLTAQQHYDWGLRAMKTCLNTGGKLIQQAKREGIRLNADAEQEILIKAVRVNTLPKLTFDDSQRFLALVTDMFPGVSSSDIAFAELEAAIREVMTNKPFNLEFDERQLHKMLQLKESLDQRMGCVVVGPSGCGKSTLWRVLQAALQKIGQRVITHVMNPKAMPRQRLLGEMDPDTREWTDGVLTAAARQVVKEPLEVRSWIVCDGDVDPEWIESLNSVLDDNKLLTLPNGERISFGPNVNFLFETHDLRFASLATISRMGMIFLSDEDVDVRRVVKRWLRMQPTDHQPPMEGLLNDLFYKSLEWVLANGAFVIDTTMVGTVMNGLSHLVGCTSRGEFVCGLVRGLGANLDLEQRATFAREVFRWAGERPPDAANPLDNYFDRSFKPLVAVNYDDQLTRKDLENGTVIRTVGVQRTLAMIQTWVDHMEPFILVGPEGCGKTMLINSVISSRKNTSVTVLHCNAQTTAEHVIQRIRQSCSLFSTNSGRVFRPREGDRLVLFLKDINLPKPDKYDTCLLIAFLQQLVTFHGFYDEQLEFLGLEKIHIVATMNPATTVGRHHLTTRFTAIVRIAYMDYPTAPELVSIYSAYLQAAFQGVKLPDPQFRTAQGFQKLSSVMIELYSQLRQKFSVDEHRHYLFTPRDLTHWVNGMLRYNVMEDNVLDALAHEAQRLFRDRLVDTESTTRFDQTISSLLRAHFKHKLDLTSCVFTSLLGGARSESKGTDGEARVSQGLPLARASLDDFRTAVETAKKMYEREEKHLNMLLFREVLDNVARIDRLLSKEGGSALLVGRSGVGRRNVATLVAHMHHHKWFSPNITPAYGVKQFWAELKGVLEVAGVRGEETTMFIEDHQITDNSILESINSLLSSGEVPGLYTHEELEPLLAPLKEEMGNQGFHYRTPYEFFVARIRQHLHIVISMDPTHPEFMVRCESNPALYSRCSILWMGEWRSASMREIPGLLIPSMMALVDDPGVVADQMMFIHNTCVERGATPRDFIYFLEQYERLYQWKREGVSSDMERLMAGLSKLLAASQTVDHLSKNAAEQQALLAEKQLAADEAMTNITQALELASRRRKEVEEYQAVSAEAEKRTQARKAEIETQLADITPALESAKQAVGQIKSDNLNEIRALKMPPEPIVDVLSAVLTLLGIEDTSWLSMRKFLGARGVKDDILNFDANRINDDIRNKCMKILKAKASSFETATIQQYAWVKANVRYSFVLERIQPLSKELADAVANLENAQLSLRKTQDELRAIDVRVGELKAEFGKRTAEAEILKRDLERTEDTLRRAQALLGQLSGERDRWQAQAQSLKKELATLPNQALLAAGYVTYLAKSPEDIRAAACKSWASMCHLDSFNFMRLMSTESQLLAWKSEGLPADELSMENALVLVHGGKRVPFIIDPATTASSWLQRFLSHDKTRPLEVVQAQDARLQTHVELAVRFGKSLMIMEVDGVDPMLYPVIRRDLYGEHPRQTVHIGDKVMDFNENFRLFLVTRNPKPYMPPDAESLVTLVNFTVTRSGLEGQLLGVTLQHEQPALEQQKSELLRKEEELKMQLAALEREVLVALAESSGDILENQALISSLTATKTKSADIEHALRVSATASAELDRQRNGYRPFASAGSALFFLVRQLQNLDNMYQFSLNSYISLFKKTLQAPMDPGSVEDRIRRLIPALEKRLLYYVGRSLFKADRLTFALHLVHGMHPELFQDNEWAMFCGDLVPDASVSSRGLPSWAPTDRAPFYVLLSTTFPTLINNLTVSDTAAWSAWMKSQRPEKEFPSSTSRVSPFQRVLVVQALRPDRLVSAMNQFVTETLSVSSVSPPPTSLPRLHEEETEPLTPVLLVTSPGADPSKDLEEFAAQKIGRSRYAELAMGGGQAEKALSMLREAAQRGDWLCLKNLHLVIAWLPVLEKELNALRPHQQFRLWLTTEPHASFPTILLQQSLKITYEAPPGVKKNLQRTYEAWSPEYIDRGSALRARVLFMLAWFHATVQERRIYVPQGWTKAYEFSFADLRAGANVVDQVIGGEANPEKVPWDFLHGLFENAIYGGRVDNGFDGRVLRAYVVKYFNSEVMSDRSNAAVRKNFSFPARASHAEYCNLISSLPDVDAARLFALPNNIERLVQRSTSSATILQIKSLGALAHGSASFDRDQWKKQLGPMLDSWAAWTKDNGACDTKAADEAARAPDLASRSPVEQFVTMEHKMGARLVADVNQALQGLRGVLYGSGLLTPDIQETADALLAHSLPKSWERQWEGPENPTAWLRGIVDRRLALAQWAEKAANRTLLQSEIRLAQLFRPGTFLNALRQQSARLLSISMDQLKFVTTFAPPITGAQLSIQLGGLTLQGAVFDGNRLGPCESDSAELVPLPSVTAAWVDARTADPYSPTSSVVAPVYNRMNREKLLTSMTLPISGDRDDWILAGVAVFLGIE